MTLQIVSLNDKYDREDGRVLLSGPQAMTRMLMSQARADRGAGLRTAGFVSGYRGSPLGVLDSTLWRAHRELERENIVFQPGVNEELAATAVHGSQQTGFYPGAKYEGVFAAWYGKGPGVDRAGDALKHGNLAGSSAHGGVLVLAGDDHPGKSSTTAHQSEQALVASLIPTLYPGSVEEILHFGLFGYALSRFSGLWIGLKCVNDTADATMSALLPPRGAFKLPTDVALPREGLNIIQGEVQLAQERRTVEFRLPAAQAFVRANGFDRCVFDPAEARLCIVTAGKAYQDVREALQLIGIDEPRARRLGIRLLKLGMTWPLDPEAVRRAARGCREVMVVEEKRAFIEPQVKEALYHVSAASRADVSGKTTPHGEALLSSIAELSPTSILDALFRRFSALGIADEALQLAEATVSGTLSNGKPGLVTARVRVPFFCSGCPHNTSTATPEGSVTLSGIGCHVLAALMPHRPHLRPVQMGGEGANWLGASPFSATSHVFQNLGDGTYFHSGILAIRAAIVAKVNITYKLLFNDAVAMTGGQPVEGTMTPLQIARELLAEGVTKLVIVADDTSRYVKLKGDLAGVTLHSREELEQVQRELRCLTGVTVIIYDQVCAAEKRRRIKRGAAPDSTKRLFINELICEGCGDCSTQSNCVSIHPVETEFGRKRKIDQSACNKDYSCNKGFCPSFVTIEGGKIRSGASGAGKLEFPVLPEPGIAACDEPVSVLVTGIGGTGVITVGAILAMAAHIEGKAASVMDMTGVSQKNGAVFSHLKIASRPATLHAVKIADGQADVLIACDMIAAASAEALRFIRPAYTTGIVNQDVVPTAEFTYTPDLDLQSTRTAQFLSAHLNTATSFAVDGARLATTLLGDSIMTNMFMVGAALQRGILPVSRQALEQAIALNGVDVKRNLLALSLGRWTVVDLAAVEALVSPEEDVTPVVPSLEVIVARRSEFLAAYQSSAYAKRYTDFVERIRQADAKVSDSLALTRAVARYLFKLMAYKDEYEIARLHVSQDFKSKLLTQFEGRPTLRFHLAPPLIAPRDKATGLPRKITLGPWILVVFRLLAALRRVRGTAFDPFGYTVERRLERGLIEDYRQRIAEALRMLKPETYSTIVELASLPENIRGFGHVKARHLAQVNITQARLLTTLAELSAPAPAGVEASREFVH